MHNAIPSNQKISSRASLSRGISSQGGQQTRKHPGKMQNARAFGLPNDLAISNPDAIETFRLVSRGVMPPADGILEPDGSPSWTLESIAKMLEISKEELMAVLRAAGPRFKR